MQKKYKILEIDPYLAPYESDINLRMAHYQETKKNLLGKEKSLSSFANGALFFGFHRQSDGWYYREWAPNAQSIALIGDFNDWNRESHQMKMISPGIWEIFVLGGDSLLHESKIKIAITTKQGTQIERIPLYSKRAVQNMETKNFDGQVWEPESDFKWTDQAFKLSKNASLFIYESHIGMSSEDERVASFEDFIHIVLPRIQKLGYNAIQLMAIAEHPYYGSFGYQVSNFFAVSSRFGTPEQLKKLINTAHEMGIVVLMDLVHSHAAINTFEGISEFDGTDYQFFHSGAKGNHPAWGTKLFNYGKPEVIHFLLSNLKFWLEEYHFDGFRFDGVTSMLYHNHALGESFDNYSKYFSINTDINAVTYLQLATELCKEVKQNCILIAEDMSGMPGMCLPIKSGGVGFDYRLGMGIPDFWIHTLKEKRDENWNMGQLWHELLQRRPQEKVIAYCESHDQALVGDKTIMFWLADQEMYWHMQKDDQNPVIERAISLHEMIRLITCACGGEGYLNFMGNEFGHPEWIDFPREGNEWSYRYATRKWSLADNAELKYQYLQNFDQAMIELVKENKLLAKKAELLQIDEQNKLIAFQKGKFLFIFNFHPVQSSQMKIQANEGISGKVCLDCQWKKFGGYVEDQSIISFKAEKANQDYFLDIAIDRRSAIVIKLNHAISVK